MDQLYGKVVTARFLHEIVCFLGDFNTKNEFLCWRILVRKGHVTSVKQNRSQRHISDERTDLDKKGWKFGCIILSINVPVND